jgi:hypothetical protein
MTDLYLRPGKILGTYSRLYPDVRKQVGAALRHALSEYEGSEPTARMPAHVPTSAGLTGTRSGSASGISTMPGPSRSSGSLRSR